MHIGAAGHSLNTEPNGGDDLFRENVPNFSKHGTRTRLDSNERTGTTGGRHVNYGVQNCLRVLLVITLIGAGSTHEIYDWNDKYKFGGIFEQQQKIEEIQKKLNYTRADGSINCDTDTMKRSLPLCVDARFNRREEDLPFTGKGTCGDVINTMTLQDNFATQVMDEECADEASNWWEASVLWRNDTVSYAAYAENNNEKAYRLALQKRLNYTKVEIISVHRCYVKGTTIPIYSEVIVSSEDEKRKTKAFGCLREKMKSTKINCDPMKLPKPYCANGKMTRDLETTPFNGSGACLDVVRTITLQVKEEVYLSDKECAEEKVRRRLDYVTSCTNTKRFTYHFWMKAYSLTRADTSQGMDMVAHNHLHHAQDNVRQTVTASTQYVQMSGFEKWQGAMFSEGNWIDTAEKSYVYSCTTQSAAYIHVKGHIRGQYLAYNSVSKVRISNTCALVSNHRPEGAPPGVQMNGMVQWSDCFLDVDYGNTYEAVGNLGVRNVRATTAWN
jgi:hypothetical protein